MNISITNVVAEEQPATVHINYVVWQPSNKSPITFAKGQLCARKSLIMMTTGRLWQHSQMKIVSSYPEVGVLVQPSGILTHSVVRSSLSLSVLEKAAHMQQREVGNCPHSRWHSHLLALSLQCQSITSKSSMVYKDEREIGMLFS